MIHAVLGGLFVLFLVFAFLAWLWWTLKRAERPVTPGEGAALKEIAMRIRQREVQR